MMKEFILSKDHKIEVNEIDEDCYEVQMFEYYSVCGWRRLGSAITYSKEACEYRYDIVL